MKMARDHECSQQPQTQGATQSQTSNLWSQVESQPIDNIVWGRLYGKNIKVKSLGTSIRPYKIIYLNTSFSVGNIYVVCVFLCISLKLCIHSLPSLIAEIFLLFMYIVFAKIFIINFMFFIDLNVETFTAGRGENNDLILTLNDLPEKILCRISKVHFTITRANCDLSNPVYIEVSFCFLPTTAKLLQI